MAVQWREPADQSHDGGCYHHRGRKVVGYHIFRGLQRALKRALTVLGCAGDCRRGLRIVGLIQSSTSVNLLASAAIREVTAAERFRRAFG